MADPSPSLGSAPSRKRRKRQKNDEEEEEEGQSGPAGPRVGPEGARGPPSWPWDNGMVIRVELFNFLCHKHMTYEPTAAINVLSGTNGSGKSAVLSAIAFAFGSKKSHTGRGKANAMLIRHGATSATVKVSLCNGSRDAREEEDDDDDDDRAYRYAVFGPVVTVQRTINKSGSSTYKLFSASGKLIGSTLFSRGCSSPRQEVQALLSHFMIHVDNPLALLPQDLAKTMLTSCNGSHLYGFYSQATQLDECRTAIGRAEEEQERARSLFSQKSGVLPTLKEQCRQWHKKAELHRDLEERHSRLVDRKREYQWSLVAREEDRWRKKIAEKDEAIKKLTNCDGRIEDAQNKRQKAQLELKDVEQALVSVKDTGVSDKPDANHESELKRDLVKKKEGARSAKREMDELCENVSQVERKVEHYEEQIQLESHRRTQLGDENAERSRVIESMEQEVAEMARLLESRQTHVANLKNDKLTRVDGQREEANHNRRAVASQLRTKEEEHLVLKSNAAGNRVNLLGRNMNNLVLAVEKAKHRFQKEPLLIGQHIRLHPKATNAEAAIVETYLRNHLSTFIVSCFEDRNVLESLQESCGTQFSTCVMDFGTRYNVNTARCSSETFPCICDLIEVENAVVFNCLVDLAKIEAVLVLPEPEAALNLLKEEVNVPKNCDSALTPSSLVYPAPHFRAYAQQSVNAKVLHRNVADVLSAQIKEISALRKDLAAADQALRDAEKESRDAQKVLDEADNDIKKVKCNIRAKNDEIARRKTEQDISRPIELDLLEEERAGAKEKLNDFLVEKARLKTALAEAEAEVETATTSLQVWKSQQRELQERTEPLLAKKAELTTTITEYDAKVAKFMQYKEKRCLPLLRTLQEESKKLGEKCDILRSDLGGVDAPVKTRNPVKIKEEIASLEQMVERNAEDLEPFEDVRRQLVACEDKYKAVKASLSGLSGHLKALKAMVRRRSEGFLYLRESITRRIRLTFASKLFRRGFAGELSLDHEREELVLNVCPAGSEHLPARDMRTLSGGEKSYATISLILSLWESMQPPFRILDEFDVFMDNYNRKVAFEQILEFAKESRRFQYIFLTPLSTDLVAKDKDCNVIHLQKASM